MNTLSFTDDAAMRVDWAAWLDEYGPQFLLYARQQCRNESEAEDVMQEAQVQLVRAVTSGSFTGTQDQWRAYVFKAVRHKAIDIARSRKVRNVYAASLQALMDEGVVEETPWLSCSADNEYLRVRIESVLRKLSPEKSEVVVLHIWGELTFQEIADVTGNKLSTITSRYRYALDDLRKELAVNPIEY